MILYYDDWKVREGDFGLTESPYGYVYFKVLQVKTNGKLFARISPSTTNKKLKKTISRVIDLNFGYWKLI